MHAPRKTTFAERYQKSPFFVGALLLHLFIGLMVGGVVVFEAIHPKAEFESTDFITGGGNLAPPPPPPSQTQVQEVVQEQQIEVQTPTQTNNQADLFSVQTSDPTSFQINVPTIMAPDTSTLTKASENVKNVVKQQQTKAYQERTAKISEFMKSFAPAGSGGTGPVGTGNQLQAVFTCYVMSAGPINAKDLIIEKLTRWWKLAAKDPERKEMEIERGPIKNLMLMINAWSQGKIKANVMGEVMTLSDDSIFKKKTPFVYFCGYQDFVLSEKEVENLRNYLVMGGCVWGDSGLAGVGSRFDIAFKREMRRVIPDADKNWEEVPASHAIFKGSTSFFQIDGGQPAGMNHRDDPVEMIRMDGEIAVLYTPNNYTDMMRMSFKPPIKEGKNEILTEPLDYRFPKDKRFLEVNYISSVTPPRYTYPGVSELFRNFTPESSENAFRLGINIVVHLLTRFQDRINFGS